MEFKSVDSRPKAGRSGEVNPFLGPVKELVAAGPDKTAAAVLTGDEIGERREFTRNVKGGDGKPTVVRGMEYRGIEKARRQLREAGTAYGVTIRSHVEHDVKGKTATITFWATDKQVRRTKDDAAPVS